MADPSFLLEIDTVEPRQTADRLAFHAGAPDWDMNLSQGVYVEPVTRTTAMLAPLPLTSAWGSTYTGLYARLAKANYTMTTPAAWVENPRLNAGDTYLESLGINEVVTTSASYGVNQAFYLSTHVHGGANESAECLRFGWGVTGATAVSVSVLASGDVLVFKGGVQVGAYGRAVMGGSNAYVSPLYGTPTSLSGRTTSFLLIPVRGRELLVVTSLGWGFCHAFADLAADGTQQTITPAAPFWWYVPAPFKASVSAAPLRYAASGTLVSAPLPVRFAPETGASWQYRAGQHAYGASAATTTFVDAVSGAAYVSDSTNVAQGRVKVVLTGDGTGTPFVYDADAIKLSAAGATVGPAVDVTASATRVTLTVPASGGATLSAETLTRGVDGAGVNRSALLGSRPVRLAVQSPTGSAGMVDLFRGATPADLPPRTFGVPMRTQYQASDREAGQFAGYVFTGDTLAYDGMILSSAILSLVTLCGYPGSAFDAGTAVPPASLPLLVRLGERRLLPQAGDTISDWISRLLRTFAPNYVTGWSPSAAGYVYRFRAPASYTVVKTLYQTAADAAGAGVAVSARAGAVVRRLTRVPVPSGTANRVVARGRDAGTGDALAAQFDDAASQNPATAPGSRPANWRGRVVSMSQDVGLVPSASVSASAAGLQSSYMTGGALWSLECDLLMTTAGVPVWKGDKMTIVNFAGGGVPVTVQVQSLVIDLAFDAAGAGTASVRACRRRAVYLCAVVG